MGRVTIGDADDLDAAVALELAGCRQTGHGSIPHRIYDVLIPDRAFGHVLLIKDSVHGENDVGGSRVHLPHLVRG